MASFAQQKHVIDTAHVRRTKGVDCVAGRTGARRTPLEPGGIDFWINNCAPLLVTRVEKAQRSMTGIGHSDICLTLLPDW